MSEFKQMLNERRDFRQSHSDPEVPRHRSKRNRAVCKKSPTHEHDYRPKELYGIKGFYWDMCVHCGKHK